MQETQLENVFFLNKYQKNVVTLERNKQWWEIYKRVIEEVSEFWKIGNVGIYTQKNYLKIERKIYLEM